VAFPLLVGAPETDSFAKRLLGEHETAVVPGRFFGAASHFRVAFGVAPETLEHGLEAIAKLLQR